AREVKRGAMGDGYSVINGPGGSAAIAAGAAALMKAIDPTLTNGTIVGRLARMADPAGTRDQTGNDRINLARALTDAGTDFVQPAGAPPVGGGGPFVGPYVVAANKHSAVPSPSSVTACSARNTNTFTCAPQRRGWGAGTETLIGR